jgi:hypothetical protein
MVKYRPLMTRNKYDGKKKIKVAGNLQICTNMQISHRFSEGEMGSASLLPGAVYPSPNIKQITWGFHQERQI